MEGTYRECVFSGFTHAAAEKEQNQAETNTKGYTTGAEKGDGERMALT